MAPSPTYFIRVHALVCAPKAQADPLRLSNGRPFGGNEVAALVVVANSYFAQAGITLLFDPVDDLDGLSNDLLAAADDNPNSRKARRDRAGLHQGKVVVYFREGAGGYADHGDNYMVALKQHGGGFLAHAGHLVHELGHYLGLDHTHRAHWGLNRPADGGKAGWFYVAEAIRCSTRSLATRLRPR